MAVIVHASVRWIGISTTVQTPAMRLPFWWFYSVLPVAFTLIALVEAVKIAQLVRTPVSEDRA